MTTLNYSSASIHECYLFSRILVYITSCFESQKQPSAIILTVVIVDSLAFYGFFLRSIFGPFVTRLYSSRAVLR